MEYDFEFENIIEAVDKYRDAVDDLVCAQINAGACRTRYDYQAREEAQEKEYEAREALERTIRDSLARCRDLFYAGERS